MEEIAKLVLETSLDEESRDKVKGELKDFIDWFGEIATKLGDSILDQLDKTMDGLYKQVGMNYEKLSESLGNTAQDAIADSIAPYFRGEMDEVEDIWDTAWNSMKLTAGAKNRLLQVSAGLLFITVMVINNKLHPASDSALGCIKTRPADAYHQPAVFCVVA